jgi:hypothetical protein
VNQEEKMRGSFNNGWLAIEQFYLANDSWCENLENDFLGEKIVSGIWNNPGNILNLLNTEKPVN